MDVVTDDVPMPRESVQCGSVFGAAALIAGSAIGGGVLALPAATAQIGLLPATTSLVVVWAYSCAQALLLIEVNVAVKRKALADVSMLGMVTATLGRPLGWALGFMYFCFSNAVLVSQLSRGSELLSSTLPMLALTPHLVGVVIIATLCATLVNTGDGSAAELVNRCLTISLITTFFMLVAFTVFNLSAGAFVSPINHWSAVPNILPICLQVLSFMNMVPLVCSYLGGNMRRARKAVVIGSLIPLVLCVTWNAMAVGLSTLVPGGIPGGSLDPVTILIDKGGYGISLLVKAFAGSAVITTILGSYLAMGEFFSEMLCGRSNVLACTSDECQSDWDKLGDMQPEEEPDRWQFPAALSLDNPQVSTWLVRACTVLPSIFVASLSPEVFYSALNISGTYFVPILFCLAPPFMAWLVRYGSLPLPFRPIFSTWKGTRVPQLVPGGTVGLVGMGVVSVWTILFAGEFGLIEVLMHMWAAA